MLLESLIHDVGRKCEGDIYETSFLTEHGVFPSFITTFDSKTESIKHFEQ